MSERFVEMLHTGGHANSLGRVDDVIAIVLQDHARLEELYNSLFDDDAWVRMRAADALEKVCRQHPKWLVPYIDKIARDLAASPQPSLQWHIAQIYRQVELTATQRQFAIKWLKGLLSRTEVDWIVAANAMETLAHFCREGYVPVHELTQQVKIQQHHKSPAVVKRATKLLHEIKQTNPSK